VQEGECELRRLRWCYIVDGLHKPILHRTWKPLAIALTGLGRGLMGRGDGGNVTNVQYKSNQNCHSEPLTYPWICLNEIYFKKKSICFWGYVISHN
jgi:hypothetical protein